MLAILQTLFPAGIYAGDTLLSKDMQVFYITGNHDKVLRRYRPLNMGKFSLTDKVMLEINDKKPGYFMAMYLMPLQKAVPGN